MLRHQPHDTTVTRTEEEESFMLSIDILRWPGVNQAFLFSLGLTTAMALIVIPFGKRRPVGTGTTWGEAMIGAVYTFFVLFLAFGVVPHQFLDHADKDLGWRKDKLLLGPFDILKPKAFGGNFPMPMQGEKAGGALTEAEILSVVCHVRYTTSGADPASQEWMSEYETWCSPESEIFKALEDGTSTFDSIEKDFAMLAEKPGAVGTEPRASITK